MFPNKINFLVKNFVTMLRTNFWSSRKHFLFCYFRKNKTFVCQKWHNVFFVKKVFSKLQRKFQLKLPKFDNLRVWSGQESTNSKSSTLKLIFKGKNKILKFCNPLKLGDKVNNSVSERLLSIGHLKSPTWNSTFWYPWLKSDQTILTWNWKFLIRRQSKLPCSLTEIIWWLII